MFEREAIAYEAAFLAGKVFMLHRRRGGAGTSPLPHAAIANYRLLTRDPKRYRRYFPRLTIIAPD